MQEQLVSARKRNNVALAVHVVWGTKDRLPLIDGLWETQLHQCICSEVTRLRCTAIAIGGTEDHVHLIVLLHPTVSLSHLLQQVKGVSSHMVNHTLQPAQPFRWNEGYSAFSMSRSHRDRAVVYVLSQKQHHARQTIESFFELPD
jgi:putative transposase